MGGWGLKLLINNVSIHGVKLPEMYFELHKKTYLRRYLVICGGKGVAVSTSNGVITQLIVKKGTIWAAG